MTAPRPFAVVCYGKNTTDVGALVDCGDHEEVWWPDGHSDVVVRDSRNHRRLDGHPDTGMPGGAWQPHELVRASPVSRSVREAKSLAESFLANPAGLDPGRAAE